MDYSIVGIDPKYAYLLGEHNWFLNSNGYVVCKIPRGDGRQLELKLHLEIGKMEWGVPEGSLVHHIDLNPLNNRVENLQVMTRANHTRLHMTGVSRPYLAERNKSEEMRERNRGNTYGKALRGDNNGNAKTTDEQWLNGIEMLYSRQIKNQAALSRELGVLRTQVTLVLQGKQRSHLQDRIREIKMKYS